MRVQVLTVREAATALSLSPWTLRKWLTETPPRLEFIRLGGRRIGITESAIQRFVDQGRVGGRGGGK
jgi:excisionase family DNA binding protein